MLVQTLRLQKGWTQEQLALVSGVGVRTIQRIERGHVASDETLKSLAAAFDLDFHALKEPPEMTSTAVSASLPEIDRARELLAFDHVRRVKRFWYGLAAWCVATPVLAAINLLHAPKYPWALFPAGFWGLALALSALRLFLGWPFGAAWERRQVEEFLGRPL